MSELYCPKQGKILHDSLVATSQWDAWVNIFDVCYVENMTNPAWVKRYWKKPDPFRKWAARQGWKVVSVRVVEMNTGGIDK